MRFVLLLLLFVCSSFAFWSDVTKIELVETSIESVFNVITSVVNKDTFICNPDFCGDSSYPVDVYDTTSRNRSVHYKWTVSMNYVLNYIPIYDTFKITPTCNYYVDVFEATEVWGDTLAVPGTTINHLYFTMEGSTDSLYAINFDLSLKFTMDTLSISLLAKRLTDSTVYPASQLDFPIISSCQAQYATDDVLPLLCELPCIVVDPNQGPPLGILESNNNVVNYLSVYPNPFNPSTIIKLAGTAELRIYDLQGRLILSQEHIDQTAWNAQGLSSGVYFLSLRTRNKANSSKLILQK